MAQGTDTEDLTTGTLRAAFQGTVLTPRQAGYDEARHIWNGMIDRRPAVIARCAGLADVRAALAFAREEHLPVAVRAGGHGVAGWATGDGALVIDLSGLRGVVVDPVRRRVRVQPGARLGDLTEETERFGLAVPAGIVTGTGVAGLTLGGGIGWLMRRWGLTCDNLRAADVLTADGELVHASDNEHPDLLWGLKGGGGNFGIVTAFEFDAQRLGPEIVGGVVLYALEDAAEILRRYDAWAADAPDELTTIFTLRTVPPLPSFPRHLHGRRVLSIGVCHAGDPAAGDVLVAPLRGFGRPVHDTVARRRFSDLQRMLDASVPDGFRYYWKSEFLPGLSDQAIETLVGFAARAPQPWSYTIVFQQGGAVARVPEKATAFGDRGARFAVNINGVTDRAANDGAVIEWVRAHWVALSPSSTGRVYVNFLGAEGQERVRAAYGDDTYRRLVALKDRYDPSNVFRLNQNIPPSGARDA